MDVAITIDVEAHRVRAEITGTTSDSLGEILSTLSSFKIRATFFVDLCEVPTWGEDFMASVCQRILDAGQDLQLHAHPHHVTRDSRRWLLSEYTREEQAAVLDFAISQYVGFVGTRPTAFRAGGFGANIETLELLRERGIGVDCSLMRGWRGCDLADVAPGVPTMLGEVRELPLTPVIILGTRARPLRTMPIDFNWLPLFALKRILRRLARDRAPVVSLLMHSSSMCMRIGATRLLHRPGNVGKLIRLLAFLRDEKIGTVSIDRLQESSAWTTPGPSEIVFVETNLVLQYVNLLYRSCIGATFRPKFALFLIANLAITLALLALLVHSIL